MNNWKTNRAAFWESAPFFRVLLPFVIGIVVYDWWPSFLPVWMAIACLVASVTAMSFMFLWRFRGAKWTSWIGFIFFNITFLLSGYLLSYQTDVRNDPRWFGNYIRSYTAARITDYPSLRVRSWRMPVSILGSFQKDKIVPATGKAILYVATDSLPLNLHKGETVLLPPAWSPIRNAGNPFEFDYARYCRRNNLFYRAFVPKKMVQLVGKAHPGDAPFFEKSHDWCMNQLDRSITDSSAKGLIQAMLLGDAVNLDENLVQTWARAGIVHIIAISGGNVVVFFIVIGWLLFWLRNQKYVWLKYAVALPLVWGYVLMAGGEPSAIRAAVMFSLLAGGIVAQRPGNALNQLLATAFCMLVAQPMWLYALGFQLSFIAVLSLILFYQPIHSHYKPRYKADKWLWETISTSLAAEILVAPLVVFYFHNFPVMFLVANIIGLFFMGVVQVLGMILCVVGGVPVAGLILGWFTALFVKIVNPTINFLESFNPVSFLTIRITIAELVCIYFVIAFLSVFVIHKNKKTLFVGMAALCLLFLLFCVDEWHDLRQNKFVVYNAGKHSRAEWITGHEYQILEEDTLPHSLEDYAVRPAHIGWQALDRKRSDGSTDALFATANKKILFIRNSFIPLDTFHVDDLYIDDTGWIRLSTLFGKYTPHTIILGQKSRKIRHKDLDSTARLCRIYFVKKNGAFVEGE